MHKPLRLNYQHFLIITPPRSVCLVTPTPHHIHSQMTLSGGDSLSDISLVWDCQLGIDRFKDVDHMSVRRDCASYHLKQSSLGSFG